MGTATRTVTVKGAQILYMRKGWNLVSFYVTPGTVNDFKEIRKGNDTIVRVMI